MSFETALPLYRSPEPTARSAGESRRTRIGGSVNIEAPFAGRSRWATAAQGYGAITGFSSK